MKTPQDDFSRITRMALDSLTNNLIFSKYVNSTYDGSVTPALSKWKVARKQVAWYLDNLKGAWLDAMKAFAGKDPHEHCNEDW